MMSNPAGPRPYQTRTDNPLGEANELFGPYDAENYLTLTLAGTMEHAAALLKYSVQLRARQYPPAAAVQNAVSALLTDLPRLHLAAERMQLLTGGPYNAGATTFYSGRQAELADIADRNRQYRLTHI